MSLSIALLLVVLVVMVFLFLTEKLPVDLTAFLGLVFLVFGGYVKPEEAFNGFASPAVITMLSIFIVSASLLHTGVADMIGGRIHAWVGGREVPLIVTLMLIAGGLSAFMNNIAATAVLMPAVTSIAHRSRIAPSKLFMPLAFGAILGGTTTLVGTPPNIIAGAMLTDRGMEPFGLFDFAPMGIVILGLGTVFMATIGRRMLPDRQVGFEPERDLTQAYQLKDRLFSIRVPKGSPVDGATLREVRLGTTLGVQVVAILRDGHRKLAPEPDARLRAGDVLLVEGRLEKVRELLRVQGMVVEKPVPGVVPRPVGGVTGIRVRAVAGSPLIGHTLKDLRFRERWGVVVVGIQRGPDLLRQELATQTLVEGDEVLAIGPEEQVRALAEDSNFERTGLGLRAVQSLQKHLYLIRIDASSPLIGQTIGDSRIGELVGLTVGGIIRDEETRLAVSPGEILREGDRLLVAGEPSRIMDLMALGEVGVESEAPESSLESEEVGVFEAAVPPRSSLAGRTIQDLKFRERYGLQVLAVWREGSAIYTRLATLVLRFGDALLLHGPRERMRDLAEDPDFVVLSEAALRPKRTSKAPLALGALGLMIGLVVTGFQPIQVAAFTAAALVVLSGAMSMEEAYRAIEWRAIFLVAAILPVGVAMERTGAASLLAESVSGIAGPLGPYAVLAALVLLSSLLSQSLDGAPAVVLLTPVVMDAASTLQLSPYPLMMGIGLAASAAFMTPFSHKANLLVMGAGGYRSFDYVRVGSPLTVVILAVLVIMIPFFFPF